MFEASVSTMYGMNRCINLLNETSQMTTAPLLDFHESLQSNNLTYNRMFKLFRTYLRAQEVDEEIARSIIGKLRVVSNTTKEIFHNIELAQYPGRSYVLDTFHVTEFYVWTPIACICAYFILFKILAYVILVCRSTPRK